MPLTSQLGVAKLPTAEDKRRGRLHIIQSLLRQLLPTLTEPYLWCSSFSTVKVVGGWWRCSMTLFISLLWWGRPTFCCSQLGYYGWSSQRNLRPILWAFGCTMSWPIVIPVQAWVYVKDSQQHVVVINIYSCQIANSCSSGVHQVFMKRNHLMAVDARSSPIYLVYLMAKVFVDQTRPASRVAGWVEWCGMCR